MSDDSVYKAEIGTVAKRSTSPLPAVFLITGTILLVLNLLRISIASILWPGFIVGFGALLLLPAWRSDAGSRHPLSFLAIPGGFVTILGIMLFVMNLTNHWESWAYAWLLLPVGAIVGLMTMYRYDQAHRIHGSGYRAIRSLLLAFMGMALFFELIVFGTLGPLWPIALIGAGAYLIWRNRLSSR